MKKLWLIPFILTFSLNAETFRIAAGAGYKKPVMEVVALFEKSGGIVEPIFGNMRQVSSQAQHADVALVIGDQRFLEKKSGLKFERFVPVGVGKLVAATPQGKELKSYESLTSLKRIAMPEPGKAIYGTAAKEFLEKSALAGPLKEKLIVVATVPQVSAYLLQNEVDAGLLNLTDALAHQKSLGSIIEIPQTLYSPIHIVAGILSPCSQTSSCESFLKLLESDASKTIMERYGL